MIIKTAKTCRMCGRIIGAGKFSQHAVEEHEEEVRREMEERNLDISIKDVEDHHDILD